MKLGELAQKSPDSSFWIYCLKDNQKFSTMSPNKIPNPGPEI